MSADALSPGDHKFEVDDRTLSYHITPSENPNAGLWVHQSIHWGFGRVLYIRSLVPLLAKHWTVLTFSPRGIDESSRPKDNDGNDDPFQMSMTPSTEDLEALRQHLKIDAFPILSGHSYAGCNILLYGELFPSRVENLVPICSLFVGYDSTHDFLHYRSMRENISPWKEAYEAWDVGPRFKPDKDTGPQPPRTDEEMTTWFLKALPLYIDDPDRYLATATAAFEGLQLPAWNWNAVYGPGFLKDEHAGKFLDKLDLIQARVLILHGIDDARVSVTSARIATKLLRGAGRHVQLAEMPGNHFPYLEAKESFMEAVEEFFNVSNS